VAAQVIAMALITLPVMMRYKYDMRYATGVLAASGTITQLVPPSLVLVVLADQLGRSVGDMYLGAWGPSLLQIAIFAAYTYYVTLVKPDALPPVARTLFGKALLIKCAWGIIPAAVLIFLVLGTIMMGLATPTEAGAMGTIGAIVLAVVRNAPLTKFDRGMFIAGCAAAIIGSLIGMVAFKSVPFKIAFTVMFAAIVWLCWRAWQFKELRDLIVQAFQATILAKKVLPTPGLPMKIALVPFWRKSRSNSRRMRVFNSARLLWCLKLKLSIECCACNRDRRKRRSMDRALRASNSRSASASSVCGKLRFPPVASEIV
jgi:TRAP-type mannitol/chloroaromatic compound transport system permease large subunit